jgi:hypothetical protein
MLWLVCGADMRNHLKSPGSLYNAGIHFSFPLLNSIVDERQNGRYSMPPAHKMLRVHDGEN